MSGAGGEAQHEPSRPEWRTPRFWAAVSVLAGGLAMAAAAVPAEARGEAAAFVGIGAAALGLAAVAASLFWLALLGRCLR